MPGRQRNSEVGQWGENVAAKWLADAGYTIVGRRVRPTRHDEIDIVALKGDTLAFVEVKPRGSAAFGRPAAAVNAAKKKALCRAASAFLRKMSFPNLYYRWDIIEVLGSPEGPAPRVNHLENAFQFPLRYRFSRQAPEPRRGVKGFWTWLFGR